MIYRIEVQKMTQHRSAALESLAAAHERSLMGTEQDLAILHTLDSIAESLLSISYALGAREARK